MEPWRRRSTEQRVSGMSVDQPLLILQSACRSVTPVLCQMVMKEGMFRCLDILEMTQGRHTALSRHVPQDGYSLRLSRGWQK